MRRALCALSLVCAVVVGARGAGAGSLPWPDPDPDPDPVACVGTLPSLTVPPGALVVLPLSLTGAPAAVQAVKFDVAAAPAVLRFLRATSFVGGTCRAAAVSATKQRITCTGLAATGDGLLLALRYRSQQAPGTTTVTLSRPLGDLAGCSLGSSRVRVE